MWRYGQQVHAAAENDAAFAMPYGVMTPGQHFAMIAQRYLHQYNADPLCFAAVKIAFSKYAAKSYNFV